MKDEEENGESESTLRKKEKEERGKREGGPMEGVMKGLSERGEEDVLSQRVPFTRRILVIRHGDRYSDCDDPTLLPLGFKQSADISLFLHELGIESLFSSPLLRCLQTAAPTGANILTHTPTHTHTQSLI
jgi:hypothetical protein